MAHYAATLGRDPDAMYRQIDIVGRTGESDPHLLVQLLYEELGRALRAVAAAIDSGNTEIKSQKATRAIAILFALEAGLDFEKGGEASKTFASLYRGARKSVIDASMHSDAARFLDIAANIGQIADVWKSLKPN